MASVPTYTVTKDQFTLPITPDVLHRFKALRLEALHEAPSSYHSNYAHESSFTDAQWISRLSDPKRQHLVCRWTRPEARQVDDTRLGLGHEIEADTWVGMFVLRGPLPNSEYVIADRQGPPLGDDSTETRWHLAGLYLQPQHRGREASIAIHEGILNFLRGWTEEHVAIVMDERTGLEQGRRARVIGTLGTEDPILRMLYDNLGAYEVGRIGRAEALRIAGNSELIAGEGGVMDGEGARKEVVVLEGVIEC